MIEWIKFIALLSIPVLIWVFSCLIIRYHNFQPDGSRKRSKHHAEKDDDRTIFIQAHNSSIYRLFEFYIKISLAIFGGFIYVITREVKTIDIEQINKTVANSIGWLLILIASIFTLMIIFHQKSKIERWRIRFSWWEPIFWIEFPLILLINTVSIAFKVIVIPSIF